MNRTVQQLKRDGNLLPTFQYHSFSLFTETVLRCDHAKIGMEERTEQAFGSLEPIQKHAFLSCEFGQMKDMGEDQVNILDTANFDRPFRQLIL